MKTKSTKNAKAAAGSEFDFSAFAGKPVKKVKVAKADPNENDGWEDADEYAGNKAKKVKVKAAAEPAAPAKKVKVKAAAEPAAPAKKAKAKVVEVAPTKPAKKAKVAEVAPAKPAKKVAAPAAPAKAPKVAAAAPKAKAKKGAITVEAVYADGEFKAKQSLPAGMTMKRNDFGADFDYNGRKVRVAVWPLASGKASIANVGFDETTGMSVIRSGTVNFAKAQDAINADLTKFFNG